MKYSNFYKNWIATCMKCGFALVKWEISMGDYKIPKDFYDYDIMTRYFIMNADFLQIRSECGHCINTKCKAYKKNQ